MFLLRLVVCCIYAVSLVEAGTIHLKTRDISTTTEGTADALQPVRRKSSSRRHLLVQFSSPVNAEHLQALAALGATVTSALDDHALTISLPDSVTLMSLDVVWVGTLRVTDKLSPALRQQPIAQPVFLVEFHGDVTQDDAQSIVRSTGLTVLPNPDMLPNQLLVLASKDQLADLAAWDEVAYIFPASTDLVNGQALMPCAGALSNGIAVAQYVKVGTGWTGEGMTGLLLNYVFSQLTTKL